MSRKRGTVVVVTAVSLVALLGFAALAIDVGHLYSTKADLQKTADASVLAAAQVLGSDPSVPESALYDIAAEYATKNHDVNGILQAGDFKVGYWDVELGGFFPSVTPYNAVGAVMRRNSDSRRVTLFLAGVLGFHEADISAAAIALAPTPASAQGSRFLIDDEMIDSDVPAIVDLAESIGMDKEDIISDLDGDWFIDLWEHCAPVNCQFELPTGEIGDEALFDMNHQTFPFPAGSVPSFADFLNFNKDSSSWRYGLLPLKMLDPLKGVSVVSDGSLYPDYVDPDFVHVSPVFKSDISELNPLPDPQVNALGWRRGLIAFKIIGVGSDPDGSGSVLPNLIIEVVDPAGIDINDLTVSGSYTTAVATVQVVR